VDVQALNTTVMSAQLLSSRSAFATATGRLPPITSLRRFYTSSSTVPSPSCGLLHSRSVLQSRGQRWQGQIYYHNSGALAIRQISFARSLPKLVLKFARVPTAFGGATIAGLAYVQYQAERQLPSPRVTFPQIGLSDIVLYR